MRSRKAKRPKFRQYVVKDGLKLRTNPPVKVERKQNPIRLLTLSPAV